LEPASAEDGCEPFHIRGEVAVTDRGFDLRQDDGRMKCIDLGEKFAKGHGWDNHEEDSRRVGAAVQNREVKKKCKASSKFV
jgi:hypothetical protein